MFDALRSIVMRLTGLRLLLQELAHEPVLIGCTQKIPRIRVPAGRQSRDTERILGLISTIS
jgi:hypothetical protein